MGACSIGAVGVVGTRMQCMLRIHYLDRLAEPNMFSGCLVFFHDAHVTRGIKEIETGHKYVDSS